MDEPAAAKDALRDAEDALAAERELSQRHVDVAGTVVMALDAEGRIVAVDRKGLEVLGHTEAALAGRSWADAMVPGPEHPTAEHHLARLDGGADDAQVECGALTTAGEVRTIAWQLTALRDANGRLAGALASGEDVTDRRRTEQRVTYLAYHDALTGLPNRRLLEEHLALAMARARRSGAGLALLHLDLDAFELVTDTLGHEAGDRLLRSVAVRVAGATRATDLLARSGGDELLLLIADVRDDPVTAAEEAAARVVTALQAPFSVAGAEFRIGCSIGISAHPHDARDATELLDHAGTAMHRAKDVARGAWAVHDGDQPDPRARLSLSMRLRRALAEDELTLPPVETRRIDRGFPGEVPEHFEASAIVTAILRLSDALGRTAVAAGVETEAQRRVLREEGCPLAQGFLLARPLPPEAVERLLEAGLSDRTSGRS